MFELFKQDIKIGDKIKLFLTTGREPEGIVIEIGENFVLLQLDDDTKNRFFDKLIGGWEMLPKEIQIEEIEKNYRISKVARDLNIGITTIVEKLKENGVFLSSNPNTKLTKKNYEFIKSQFNDIPSNLVRINLGSSTDTKKNDKTSSTNIGIDKKLLLDCTLRLKSALPNFELNKTIEPNANIILVRGTTCIASNNEYSKILILNNKIIDNELVSEVEQFETGSIIPVVIHFYSSRNNKEAMASVVIKPNSILNVMNSLINFIEQDKFNEASLISSIIKNNLNLNKNKDFGALRIELKKAFNPIRTQNPTKLNIQHPEDKGQRKIFKDVEKEINDLIRQSKFEFALSQIEKELNRNIIEDKYKSSLLLKKAQIYSSINNPESSETAYQELVNFNEKIKAPDNNLSHLYTELARLQALSPDKQMQAVDSVKKALKYNPNNNFALNLLNQFEGKSISREVKNISKKNFDDHILIEAEDDSNTLSKMIDLDIKEYKFSHPEIIKNGGKPTAYIAEIILKDIRDSGGFKVTENYPSFLELAKAYSELNIGSYELKDYLESVAYYSMLKGNSLFNQFRNNLINGQIEAKQLYRLNESAGDYYIETLNILSNIDSKSLVLVLTNYLQLKVARYYLESGISYDYNNLFETKFTSLFNSCIYSKENFVKNISIKTIIDIGSNSFSMWNKLNGIFQSEIRFKAIFDKDSTKILINNVLNTNLDIKLNASQFLMATFNYQKTLITEFNSKINKFLQLEFTPTNFRSIQEDWNSLMKFNHLLQKTDKEILGEVETIILVIQPYLNRSDKERGNILYSVLKSIDIQIDFINYNTTFYGRTFYYRLLNRWRREVDNLLEEKIAQSYPSLVVSIDPPYFIETNGVFSAPLIIKNQGEATTEGFFLKIICESTEYDESVEIPFETTEELESGGKKEINFVIPGQILDDSNAVEIRIDIEAIYQKKKLLLKNYEFTIEKEPVSFLQTEEIPWQTGHSTPAKLFFGREKLINDILLKHYKSNNRDKPYILYGLTRTGKSSILEYLRKKIEGTNVNVNGKHEKFIAFEWQLQEISNNINARDFYEDILLQRTYYILKKVLERDNNWDGTFKIDEKGKFSDLKKILEFLKSKSYYPIYFVDEFSFIKDLMDRGTISKGFLAALREYSLTGLASFVFAGTYDIKKLITDERYGITGQLVHIIEYQVDNIEDEDAESIISIIEDKLSFTPEAIDQIKLLSGNIPYFIQIICKNCGDYAVENKRRYIGYPELEKVIRILTGEENFDSTLLVRLPSGTFQNNQYSPTDPKEVNVLISSICYFNKGGLTPRGVGSHEIEKFWSEKGLISFKSKLAVAFQSLIDRKILIESIDEGIPVYKFSVDLFRRWWLVSHQDINLEIATLKEE